MVFKSSLIECKETKNIAAIKNIIKYLSAFLKIDVFSVFLEFMVPYTHLVDFYL